MSPFSPMHDFFLCQTRNNYSSLTLSHMAVLVVKQTFDNFANKRLIDKHMTNKQYLIRFKQMFKCRIFRFERVWGFCPVSNPRNHGADGPALLQLLPSTRWDNDPGGGAHGGGGGGALEGGGGGDGVDDKTDGDSSRGECEWLFGLQCCYSREWVGTGMLSAKTMAMILILTLKVHHGAPQRHKPSDQWYQVYHQVYHWSWWQYCNLFLPWCIAHTVMTVTVSMALLTLNPSIRFPCLLLSQVVPCRWGGVTNLITFAVKSKLNEILQGLFFFSI